MGRAVNLVVSCSNRKRYETAPGLVAGALEKGGVQRRLRAWGKRLNDSRAERHAAEDVYMGEHWSVARIIPAEAKEFGWSVRLWICSAGYGLIRPSTKIRAYQATFARGTEDFVAPGTEGHEPIRAWWSGACSLDLPEEESFPRSFTSLAQAYPRTPLIVALSADYLNAIEQDLRGALEYSYFERHLSIISSGMRADHPHWKSNLLPCDGRLSASLGGTFTSLNTRIARFLLRSPADFEPTVEHFRCLVRSIESRTPPPLSRIPQSDSEVEKFIHERLKETPPASKTRLLEQFRATGKACEQKRFGELYQRLRWGADLASMAKKKATTLRRRALRIEQCKGHPLYLLCLTGDEVLAVADISRVSRDEAGKLLGYQRAEVKRHVQGIVDYLNSDKVLFPNSLILALSSRVRFIPSRGPHVRDGLVAAGTLEIPLPRQGGRKPAWIVDGQQRALAISKSRRKGLLVPVNAFIADDVEIQRDQFLRVNNTKPLPRGLISELLPEVSSPLPANLEARKIPSAICDLLNTDPSSPFHQLIRRTSSSADGKAKAVISDTSIIKFVQESITSPSGCLFPYRNMASGETDFDGIWKVLVAYWTAVKQTFPEAWGKPPSKSRLMHGAGLRSMGRLMDRVMSSIDPTVPHALSHVKHELQVIAPVCHWNSGTWEELGGLHWNEIQNVPRHIRILSSFLIRTYVQNRGIAR